MTGRTDRIRIALSLLIGSIIGFSVVFHVTTDALAFTVVTYRDTFRSVTYSGDDGSASWDGPWQEEGEADGPGAGMISVAANGRCPGGGGYCLHLGSATTVAADHGVTRSADLRDTIEASLSFEYRRATLGHASGSVTVEISSNGGGAWEELDTIDLNGANSSATASYDITEASGGVVLLRFSLVGADLVGVLLVDDVTISATQSPDSTTTTTTPASTTTTTTTPASTTTTTTTPASTTTTTTPASTTTTTTPASTTTTTTTGSSTTTAPTSTTVPTASPGGDETVAQTSSTTTVAAGATSTTVVDALVAGTTTSTTPPNGVGSATNLAFTSPRWMLTPVEGLQITYSTASETISNNALSIVLLAALTGGLSIAGLERRRSRAKSPKRPGRDPNDAHLWTAPTDD